MGIGVFVSVVEPVANYPRNTGRLFAALAQTVKGQALYSFPLLLGERWPQQDVREDVKGRAEVALEDLQVNGAVVVAGLEVEAGTEKLELAGEVEGASLSGAFVHHVEGNGEEPGFAFRVR